MGKIITTVNMKGGVGKTTLTVNLAACLVKNHQQRVLVVDLDTQVSATLSLIMPQDFAKIRKAGRTLSQLIKQSLYQQDYLNLAIQELIQSEVCRLPGMDLLPGDIELYDDFLISEILHYRSIREQGLDFEVVWQKFEQEFVAGILAPVKDSYDLIILDCAPSYNLLTRSALLASDFYLMPCRPEPLSIVGTQLLERRINQLRRLQINQQVMHSKLLGIVFVAASSNVLNMYYNQVMRRVNDDFAPEQLFKTKIPLDVNVAKAVDSFSPVVLNNPNSSGSKAFIKLAEEVIQKINLVNA
ncbi:MAG: ParA family protein [Coleofasciculaceae cyanobacterium SM2_1_6]|nr:ParA family protein [Coleofasciculaceae cyanobacterium SM2_1_6]